MKLNWFSPLPPAPTDIGHFTKRVLPALAARADVSLWTDQTKWEPGLAEHAEIRRYDLHHPPWADLNRADVCVYNIGNNPLFHGSIWQIARQHAGVVILHDTSLHHFFDGLYRVQRRDLSTYLELMEFYYGAEGRQDAYECFMAEARNINEMAEKYPLTELAVANALGVIVHTEPALAALSQSVPFMLRCLPLPFALPRIEHDRKVRNRATPYRLILFGYLGRNRRLEAVFQALADFPEREKFHLDIYGSVLDDEKQLRSQLRSLGIRSLVTFHGFATEGVLDEALAKADLAINLRYPTMGEASGSQLRIWAHTLPSLVTNVGWYSTLSDEAVAFVRADVNEVADIQAHLRDFLEQPDRFVKMGAHGCNILAQQHAPESYVKNLLEFLTEASQYRAPAAALKLAERAGELTSELMSKPSDSILTNVAGEIGALAGMDQ